MKSDVVVCGAGTGVTAVRPMIIVDMSSRQRARGWWVGRRVGLERFRRPCLVAIRATLPQKWPPPPPE